jgi:hypothetical protein
MSSSKELESEFSLHFRISPYTYMLQYAFAFLIVSNDS